MLIYSSGEKKIDFFDFILGAPLSLMRYRERKSDSTYRSQVLKSSIDSRHMEYSWTFSSIDAQPPMIFQIASDRLPIECI